MTMENLNGRTFLPGANAHHEKFGNGSVLIDNGETVVVRFLHGIEECDKNQLDPLSSPKEKLLNQSDDPIGDVICRVQAECISSINDVWGTFSRSRIALLPHQLWVCRKVLERWPTRWLVADDVGLGKTIEAGLILLPLISQRRAERVLILCPASLVDQWRYRMFSMFDLRFTPYSTDQDHGRVPFWEAHSQVVASFHTLRDDRNERHKRLFEASKWDLLIVDEAHHLNVDESSGATLGYRLVKELGDRNLVESMVFFTGTPHRGKNFGFLSLLKLLRDEFDPKRPVTEQLHLVKDVMIRNNKLSVTDMKGMRLFKKPIVLSEIYQYSTSEEDFYARLTEFIATGQAYASKLGATQERAVMLTLVAMQKLASSSIAAIKKAVRGRLERIRNQTGKVTQDRVEDDFDIEAEVEEDFEIINQATETRPARGKLALMDGEIPKLEMLLSLAEGVPQETKLEKILALMGDKFQGKSVLLFTEYKATQAVIFSRLAENFGREQVAFINGDERLEGAVINGKPLPPISMVRSEAASGFNQGRFRYLISTEAAGEGIDLQEACHCLVHVDLPWNPMRLHQRVGRLNRYGQKHQVQIVNLRNPATIESRIWDILNNKLNTIMNAFGPVMDEPEDLLQLVLGMVSNRFFDEMFAEGSVRSKETLSQWFDQKTARLGNQDAVELVRDLVGHCEKFDFKEVSREAPQVDLPDLKMFFCRMLAKNQRRVNHSDDLISFKTPEGWLKTLGMRLDYQEMAFRRDAPSKDIQKILGVGHKVFDRALAEGKKIQASIGVVSRKVLSEPIFVFRVQDRLTGQETQVRAICFGVRVGPSGNQVLRDWELLQFLNQPEVGKELQPAERSFVPSVEMLEKARTRIDEWLGQNYIPFKKPHAEFMALFMPPAGKSVGEPEENHT